MISYPQANALAEQLREKGQTSLMNAFIRYGRFTIEYRPEIAGNQKWEVMEGTGFVSHQPNAERALMVLSEMVGDPTFDPTQVFVIDKKFGDRTAFLEDGWAVRFNGEVQSPRWRDEGGAKAYLDLLQRGEMKPEPQSMEAVKLSRGRR